jgi:hypothetical protein
MYNSRMPLETCNVTDSIVFPCCNISAYHVTMWVECSLPDACNICIVVDICDILPDPPCACAYMPRVIHYVPLSVVSPVRLLAEADPLHLRGWWFVLVSKQIIRVWYPAVERWRCVLDLFDGIARRSGIVSRTFGESLDTPIRGLKSAEFLWLTLTGAHLAVGHLGGMLRWYFLICSCTFFFFKKSNSYTHFIDDMWQDLLKNKYHRSKSLTHVKTKPYGSHFLRTNEN